MNATGPVIQVVSGGTSWPAIVAAISGGLVGLAGIGATVWASVRNSRAEDSRAHLAEKRRVYVNCLTAVHEMIRIQRLPPGDERNSAQEEVLIRMLTAVSAVRLIGNKDVTALADGVGFSVLQDFDFSSQDKDVGTDTPTLHIRLLAAMRADLGEPRLATPGLIGMKRF